MTKRETLTENSTLSPEELDALLEDVGVEFPVLPVVEAEKEPNDGPQKEARKAFCREQIASLGNIELEVRIELGQTTMLLSEVTRLRPGSVVILDQHVNEPVRVLVNGKAIASGELIIVDGCFSVRITEFL